MFVIWYVPLVFTKSLYLIDYFESSDKYTPQMTSDKMKDLARWCAKGTAEITEVLN